MPSPPAETLALSGALPQVGIGLSCDEKVPTLTYVGGRVVVTPSEKEGGLSWLEELGDGDSVEDRPDDDICGAPDDTDVDGLGSREEEDEIDELLSAPPTDDVDRNVLAVASDREAVVRRLDDPEVETKAPEVEDELDKEALADS